MVERGIRQPKDWQQEKVGYEFAATKGLLDLIKVAKMIEPSFFASPDDVVKNRKVIGKLVESISIFRKQLDVYVTEFENEDNKRKKKKDHPEIIRQLIRARDFFTYFKNSLNEYLQFSEECVTCDDMYGEPLKEIDLLMRKKFLGNKTKIDELFLALGDIKKLNVESKYSGKQILKGVGKVAVATSLLLALAGVFQSDKSEMAGSEVTISDTMGGDEDGSQVASNIDSKKFYKMKVFLDAGPSSKRNKGIGQLMNKPKEGGISPNMYDSESGGEGVNGEETNSLGEIENPWTNGVDEALWSTGYYFPNRDGNLIPVKMTHESYSTHDRVRVKLVPISGIKKNDVLTLPVPYGYVLTDVRTNRDSDVYISRSADASSIQFDDDVDGEVVITYSINKSKVDFVMPNERRADKIYRPPDQKKVIDSLVYSHDAGLPDVDDMEDILENYLSEFTYVVSDELQGIINELTVSGKFTLEEVIGRLRVGDCDLLSSHVSHLLNDAGFESYVATGYVGDSIIHGDMPHAKVVIESGIEETFETTSPTSRQLRGLKFSEEDMAKLTVMVEKLKNSSEDERLEKLEEFGVVMKQMLNDSKYDEFIATSEIGSLKDLEQMAKSILSSIEKSFTFGPGDFKEALLMLSLFLSSIFLTVGGILGVGKIFKKVHNRLRRGQIIDIGDIVDMKSDSGESFQSENKHETEDQINKIIKKKYESFEGKVQLDQLIPLAKVMSWGLDRKRHFLEIFNLSSRLMDDYGSMRIISTLLTKGLWNKLIDRAKVDGVDLEKTLDDLRNLFIDPKILKKFEEVYLKEELAGLLSSGMVLAKNVRKPASGRDNLSGYMSSLGLADVSGQIDGRSVNQKGLGIDTYGFRDYSPGSDSASSLSQRMLARDQCVVRETAAEAGSREAESVDVAINIDNMDDIELQRLSSMLFLTAQKKKIAVSSIRIFHYGNMVKEISEQTMSKMFSLPRSNIGSNVGLGVEATKYILETLIKLRLKYTFSDAPKFYKSADYPDERSIQRENAELGVSEVVAGSSRPMLMIGFFDRRNQVSEARARAKAEGKSIFISADYYNE